MELDQRVVVDEVVEPLSPHAERGDYLAVVQRFLPVRDDARFDEIDDTVGEHLRMQAQVVFVSQVREDRIGDHSDPRLNRRPVADQPRHILAYSHGHFVGLGWRPRDQGQVALYDIIYILQMHEAVAECSGHLFVDLCDHDLGHIRPRLDNVDRDSERAVPVTVGRRDLDERDVDLKPARPDMVGEFGEEYRCIFGPALVDRIPDVRSDKERVLFERPAQHRLGIRGGSKLDDIDSLVIGY